MPVRQGSAVWEGTLKRGHGVMRSGACEGAYTAASRFEAGNGTNPEEFIAAAHAGCFSQALSLELEQAGFPPERIETRAHVHIDKMDGGFSITRVDLQTEAHVPGIAEGIFHQRAEAAKSGCPVSRALRAIEITLEARLVSE